MEHQQISRLLHAYVDGELDAAGMRKVLEHLPTCESCHRTEQQIRTLRRALTAGAARYRLPRTLRGNIHGALRREANLPPQLLARWLMFAAGAACASFVFGIVFFVLPPVSRSSLADQVLADHLRSLLATHLVDVESSDQHTVKPWFDGKLDFAPPVRDLSASQFPLIGGRLDYLDGNVIAALVYRRNKHPINLFVRPAADKHEIQPSLSTRRGYNMMHWVAHEMEYWAVSDLNETELRQFAAFFAS